MARPRLNNSLLAGHVGTLAVGALSGVLLAWLLAGLDLDFSAGLRQARELGIVSRTILAGYPKARDTFVFVSLVGLPLLGGGGCWLAWAGQGRRAGLREFFDGAEMDVPTRSTSGRRRFLLVTGMVVAAFLLAFDRRHFFMPNANAVVGSWPLLGEEGVILAWVQSILNGGVYGRDFFCLYGPMLVYPLAWLMKIFGRTVVVAREYSFALNMVAIGLLATMLSRVVRARWLWPAAILLFTVIFCCQLQQSANCSLLRVVLGLFVLYLGHRFVETGTGRYLAAAGLVAGQSLLLSQEVGLCALLALAAMLGADWWYGRSGARFLRGITTVGAAFLASLAPFLLYCFFNGALSAVWDNYRTCLQGWTLGYGALRFPSPATFLANPFRDDLLLPYWVIMVYMVTGLSVLPRLLIRCDKERVILQGGILLFGLLVFRVALGRSDAYHVFFVSPPALLLTILTLDKAVTGLRSSGTRLSRVWAGGVAALILVALLALFSFVSYFRAGYGVAVNRLSRFGEKWTAIPSDVTVLDLPRGGGIRVPAELQSSIRLIRYFVDRDTAPGDLVYFFPNEAVYYFLFDRNNPTRFAVSYFAITRTQRQELVADLERRKPRYVVYSPRTWRVDDIPEQVQVPEVVTYLQQRYQSHQRMGDVVILRRIGP